MEEERMEDDEVQQLNISSEIEKFLSEIELIDHLLKKNELDIEYSKKLIQGPFSDILTHIGQIAMLQRIMGNPIARENYSNAYIKSGRS